MAETKESKKQYWGAVGRRKTAIASVRISKDDKTITVNGKKDDGNDIYFSPMVLVGVKDDFGISIKLSGGGKESQLGAARLGVARALEKFNPDFRTTLKKAGFLTRDSREKERKKFGLRGARRAPQWAKR